MYVLRTVLLIKGGNEMGKIKDFRQKGKRKRTKEKRKRREKKRKRTKKYE